MRVVLSLAIALMLVPTLGAAPPAGDKTKAKAIDLVLCLDTSNSMDGLIDSAKRKLWTIVNDLAKIEPAPTFRVALYSYGNDTYSPATGWVRKDLDLTTDLDEVYRQLYALRTQGGTELVARVSRTALSELKWTEGDDVLRIMFVCGNEPANQDKEVGYEAVASAAKAKGVVINAIFCGAANHADAFSWIAFAKACHGKFANIDTDKAEIAIVTPFDGEIEKLSTKINETCVWYGAKGRGAAANQLAQDANAAKEKGGVAADRGVTKAGKFYCNAEADLIDRMQTDKTFDITKMKDEEFPEDMRKMKPEERLAHLKKKAEERAEIQKKVADLAAKRAKFIADEKKKSPKSATEKAFDDALTAMLREQTAAKGMTVRN